MDGGTLDGVERRALVHRLADDVQDTTEGVAADRDGNHVAGVPDLQAARQALGAVHGDTADRVLPEVLGDLQDQVPVLVADGRIADLQGVVDGRKGAVVELDVDDGAHDLGDLTDVHASSP